MNKRTRNQLIIMVIIVSVFVSIAGCGRNVTAKTNSNIAVITKSTTSTFFKVVFDGAHNAANEYEIEVTCEGPDDENDYQAQNELIEAAIDNRVGAIVISAIDKEKSTELLEKAQEEGIHVVVIDSGINSDLVEASVETDNYEAGKKMAEALLESKDIGSKRIGIVNFNSDSKNVLEREDGFVDTIEASGMTEIVGRIQVNSNVGEAKEEALKFIEENQEMDIIVSFNEWTTLGVGFAIKEKGLQDQIQVVGFDNNVISVAMLESGEIDGLIVQNPYEMGYLGVEIACRLMRGEQLEEAIVTTDIKYITRENLYEEDSQKLLFPLAE